MHTGGFSVRKTAGTGLQRCGKHDLVKWVILHHILNKWASTCWTEKRTREKYRSKYLTPTMSSSAVLCWLGLGPLVPLAGRVTTNQYKNIAILMGVVTSRMVILHPQGMRIYWMVLTKVNQRYIFCKNGFHPFLFSSRDLQNPYHCIVYIVISFCR